MKRRETGLLAGLMLAWLCGCAAPKIADYRPAGGLSGTAMIQEAGGCRVAVDPFTDATRSGEYFKFHALRAGVMIMHVTMENRSGDQTRLIRKDQFAFQVAGGSETNALFQVGSRSGSGEAMIITGAVLGSVPLLFLGGQMVGKAEVARQNMVAKELTDRTLAPGQSHSGFVYCRLPKGFEKEGTVRVRIRLSSTDGGEDVTMSFPIPYAQK